MKKKKYNIKETNMSDDRSLTASEDVKSYTYVGDKPKKTHKIPLALAVSLVAIALVTGMLLSFASCAFYTNFGPSNIGGNQDDSVALPSEEATAELPEYIKDLAKLDAVFKNYSYDGIDEEAMASMVLKAYVAATGDPYASYMTGEEYEQYMKDMEGEFVGIGISITETLVEISGFEYKAYEIISVYADSPALENGVKVGDYILYVGKGENKTLIDTLGFEKAFASMLGEEGTYAEFVVFRRDSKSESDFVQIEFSIPRRKIITESVRYRVSETNSKVGIIHIMSFDITTAEQFTIAVDSLKKNGCEYFVFDLRYCPGGALLSIEKVLSFFLDKGDLIIGVEYNDGTKSADYVGVVDYAKWYGEDYRPYNVEAKDIGKYKGLKSVVLVNKQTASAAELFTATFRDYGLAQIVGETTYGKGCMQNTYLLDEYGLDGALKLTMAMYFSKSHHIYHNIGIIPDCEVELSDEAYEYNFYLLPESLDNQLQKAIEVLLK